MKLINSSKAKIVDCNFLVLSQTVDKYRNAVAFFVNVIDKEWNRFKELTTKESYNLVERLTIETKKNPTPLYNFKNGFHKFPSYLRRSAIADSYGIVSSYYSNLENYNKEKEIVLLNNKRFAKKPPKLNKWHFKCPALYEGNMYEKLDDNLVRIKVFKNNDWVWQIIKLRNTDINYIKNRFSNDKVFSPILIKKGRKFYLQYAFEKKVILPKLKYPNTKVCSVDLGLNHSAVCSIIDSKGTVIDRLFINQPIEKDHLNRLLNRYRLKCKQGGRNNKPKIWGKINGLNTQIVNDTVNKILNFAISNNADVLVFEYLEFQGKKFGSKAIRLQLWAKRRIQEKCQHQAHNYGLHFSRVSAKNTSKLAFDGSGIVVRNSKNASLCTFKNGKKYNCDLNASYNIGARYFIREIEKTISEKEWLQYEVKVPCIARRTHCTLSTFKNLIVAMA